MKKTLYIVGSSAMGIALAYFGYDLYRTNKSKKDAIANKIDVKGDEKGKVSEGQESSQAKKQSKDGFPLKVGAYGFKVFLLQSALNKIGSSLTVDGKFGEKTYDEINVQTKQWNYGCTFGSICGLDREEYIGILKKATSLGFRQKEVEILAKENWIPFAGNFSEIFTKK